MQEALAPAQVLVTLSWNGLKVDKTNQTGGTGMGQWGAVLSIPRHTACLCPLSIQVSLKIVMY